MCKALEQIYHDGLALLEVAEMFRIGSFELMDY